MGSVWLYVFPLSVVDLPKDFNVSFISLLHHSFIYRNLMEDIDLLRIDSPSFFALGKL